METGEERAKKEEDNKDVSNNDDSKDVYTLLCHEYCYRRG